MDYRPGEIRVGIFLAVSIVLFIAFLFAIKGIGAVQARDEYFVHLKFVGGIEEGSPVRLAGVPVGRVRAFSMIDDDDEPMVRLYLQLKRGVPIRADSEAFMSTIGIMGSYYIEITAGSHQASLLPAGSVIPAREVMGFAQMSGPIGDATVEAKQSLAHLNDLLNEQNRQNLSAIIASLRQITDDNGEAMTALIQNVNRLSIDLNRTVNGLHHFISANDTSVQSGLRHTEALLVESRQLTQQLQHTVQQLNGMLLENRETYRGTLENLHRVSGNLESFSQTIKEQPWNLLRKNYPPQRKLD